METSFSCHPHSVSTEFTDNRDFDQDIRLLAMSFVKPFCSACHHQQCVSRLLSL